ncbi:PKD domain-containing protein [Flavihumibacter sp. R14]|nr:PKD domain-containing protein [Flavihumibacter soli]
MKTLYSKLPILVMLAMVILSGCEKDDKIPPSTIGFTATATNLSVDFTNESTNTRYFSWDFGDGSDPSTDINPSHFYEDEGTYTVTLTATGRDGKVNTQAAQVTVTAPENFVKGGKMEAADISNWTVLKISDGVDITFENGKAIARGGNWGHAAIYQAIQVEANQKYTFSALVAGSGATETWLETYFGALPPVQNSDYSSGGNQFGLSTWDGCGSTPFNGNLATLACAGAQKGKDGEITFSQSGTVYLLIKTGGNNLGAGGISIDNISLVKKD